MTKSKRFTVTLTAICLVLVLILGILFGVERHISRFDDVHFEVEDTLPDGNGKLVRVVLLAGQSNASGCARDEYLKKNVTPEKYAEYEAGYANVLINYRTTNNLGSAGFVKASVRQGEPVLTTGAVGGCFGPELGLAEKLSQDHPDDLFAIIKYAIGGSDLNEDWLSPSAWGKTGIYYAAFVGFVNSNIEYLISKNYKVEIEGMCWMQGESDSVVKRHARLYKKNLKCFISDVRREFGEYSSSDGIAFVDAYIADLPYIWVYGDIVNRTKKAIADSSPLNRVVDTVSAGIHPGNEPPENPDPVHYGSMNQILLGNLFAASLDPFLD